jgi:uncharacterized protein YbjT (DUF2867 family)
MILVTGITGKSGKWFLERLIKENRKDLQLRVIVRKGSDTTRIDNSGLNIQKVYGDLSDKSFVEQCVKDVQTVLHIAGIQKSLNVVEAAIKNNVTWLILVHTTGIYSKYKKASADYLEIEKKIQSKIANSKIALTILRPTMIYGSLNDGNMTVFIKMVDKLRFFPVVNGGKYALQPVYEKDLGDAYYQVLTHADVTKNRNYNLSGKNPILLIDIFKLIGENLNKRNTFISIPFPAAYACSLILFVVSFGLVDYRERVQRLVERRTFSHEDAVQDFNYSPIPFADGLKMQVQKYLAASAG